MELRNRHKVEENRHELGRYFRTIIIVLALFPYQSTVAKEVSVPIVRIAEIEINLVHLDAYKAAVIEEIKSAVQNEPGVLAIYCVAEKEHPTRFRLLEIYADQAAYDAHIAGIYFGKYAAATEGMIVSKKLIETTPVQLSSKTRS